jgi:superfamily II DNA or RNA helicase
MQNTSNDLFNKDFPSGYSYPTNIDKNAKVERFIKEEFEASGDFLVVTGFSSLEYLINFLGRSVYDKKVRIVLGNEPLYNQNTKRQNYFASKAELSQEIFDYWIEQGISPLQSAAVINLIEYIKKEVIDFRILDNLHAKIYIGEKHAILGSSNFSYSGLRHQFEANFRVAKKDNEHHYNEKKRLAEYYYKKGADFNQKIIDLLNRLLRYVTWKEALARAVSELTEGEWLKEYPEFLKLLTNLTPPLWKTQIEAIGQALYIMDNNGSLLIADPTGSGKTRLGAVLQACIINRLWLRGGGFGVQKTNTLLICPPQVQDNWKYEFRGIGSDFENVVSQGRLSTGTAKSVDEVNEKIKNARILFIDEAHNFLNKGSKRSLTIQYNTADNLVLYTATPINRRVEDIFRLIEILDVDNLTDNAINKFEKLAQIARKGLSIGRENEKVLREYLRDFLIRRTKKELNKKIDEDPKMYCNISGIPCRYPKQICKSYKINETDSDIDIVKKINNLSSQLRGLIRLREINLKKGELADVELQKKIFEHRQNAAQALSIYGLQATLRSSRIALIEHLKGTIHAKEILDKIGYPIPKSIKQDNETGNVIAKLEAYKKELPKHNLTATLPSWFTNLNEYAEECEKELKIYKEIYSLSLQLSNQREERKAQFLVDLLKRNHLLLAFDSRVISLYFIKKIAEKLGEKKEVEYLVVTGGNSTAKKQAKEYFGFGSEKKNVIGFCSDVMSEGVNLQQASAVVLLDMPSVMRIAEQRIGRIDRMNSPHEEVEIYFPDDHEEFTLQTDKKFYLTAQAVENVLGGNLDLPEDQLEKWRIEKFSAKQVIKLYEEEKEKSESNYADGVQDAFQAVKDMIFGEDNIIDIATYDSVKESKATLLSKVDVSKVQSVHDFAFFCIRGSKYYAPYWLYIDEETVKERKSKVLKDLPRICQKLRVNLSSASDLQKNECIEEEQSIKERFIEIIKQNEITNLPNKKRRALKLLSTIVTDYLNAGTLFETLDERRKSVLQDLQKITNNKVENSFSIDYYQLAQDWIRLIQPRLIELKKNTTNKRKIIHLSSEVFRHKLRSKPISTEELEDLRDSIVTTNPLDKRIASCIIGIGKRNIQKNHNR